MTLESDNPYGKGAIIFANVPRQVSLAGGVGGSHETGAKALGLLV